MPTKNETPEVEIADPALEIMPAERHSSLKKEIQKVWLETNEAFDLDNLDATMRVRDFIVFLEKASTMVRANFDKKVADNKSATLATVTKIRGKDKEDIFSL